MKGGVTKRIEDVTKALEQGQLKKALYLSEARGLERHHEWIEDAARFCLTNKEDRNACNDAIQEAREKIQSTVTLPIDDTGLEGLEEYLSQQKPVEAMPAPEPEKQHTADDELYENCEECHVAVAASKFADICEEKPEEAGSCLLIGHSLARDDTEPAEWLKAMVRTAEEAKGKAKEEMVASLVELTDYLEKRSSPILEALKKEEGNGQKTTVVPPHNEEPAGERQ